MSNSELTKKIMKMATPTILDNMLVTMISFVNTAMVGGLGKVATAAVAINSSPQWLISGLISVVSVGATVMIAQCVGAKDYTKANKIARQSLVMSAIFGAVVMILMRSISPFLSVWMNASDEIVPLAASYLRIISGGYLMHYVSMTMSGVLRGSGDMKSPLVINIFTNVLNLFGDFMLIYTTRETTLFGHNIAIWGAGLGINGAALSSAIAMSVSGVFMILAMTKRNKAIRLTLKESYRVERCIVTPMFRIGLPAALEHAAVYLGQIQFQSMVTGLGTVSLAAHHLATTAEAVVYMPAFGFGVSATTLVGQAVGAGDGKDAYRYGIMTSKIGIITMVLLSSILFIFPDKLLGLFTKDLDVIKEGIIALKIVSFAEPFYAASIICSGALRGSGDTVWPLIISLIGMWGVRIALSWALSYPLGLGLAGAWLGMSADLMLRGIFMYVRLLRRQEHLHAINVNCS